MQLGNTEMAALFTSYRGFHQRIKRQLDLVRSIPPPPPPLTSPQPVVGAEPPAATDTTVATVPVTVTESPAAKTAETCVPTTTAATALSDRRLDTVPMAAVVDLLATPAPGTDASAASVPALP